MVQANTGRYFLSFEGTLRRSTGLGQEQMTQGHRWDTAGQPRKSRSLIKPSLTVILGVKSLGKPLRAG